ncbi:MAG: alpha/beta fold hydrolase [Gammaproteobacteria bacterium]
MVDSVILVHGLWMISLVMRPLARRLRHCGLQPELFDYRSLRNTLHANSTALIQTVRQHPDRCVHLVGHSLGGLLILQALQDEPALIDGRVVLLGSPVNGSVVARRLYRRQLSRRLVGRSAAGRLVLGGSGWHGRQQVGVIAGTRPVGVGHALGGLTGPNDGTVTLAETRLAGCTDTLEVNTTHTGLLVSHEVALAVCRFLRAGRFSGRA